MCYAERRLRDIIRKPGVSKQVPPREKAHGPTMSSSRRELDAFPPGPSQTGGTFETRQPESLNRFGEGVSL